MSGFRGRLLTIGLSGLALALLLGVTAILLMDWRGAVAHPVSTILTKRLQRPVAINGPVNFRLGVSGPSIVLRDVTLANAPWGSRPDMASAKRVELHLRWLPLFSERIEISSISIEHAAARIETNVDGFTNRPRPVTARGAPVRVKGFPVTGPASLAIGDLALDYQGAQDAGVFHMDIQDAVITRLANAAEIRGNGTFRGAKIGFEARLSEPGLILHDESSPIRASFTVGETHVLANGRVSNPARGAGVELRVDGSGPNLRDFGTLMGIDDLSEDGPLNFSFDLSLTKETLSVEDISAGLGTGTMVGTLESRAKPGEPGVSVDALFASDTLDLELLRGNWGKLIDLPQLWSLPIPLDIWRTSDVHLTYQAQSVGYRDLELFDVDGNASLAEGVLTIYPFTFRVADVPVDGQMTLDLRGKQPDAALKLETRRLAVGDALAKTQTLTGLESPLDLSVDVTGRGGSLRAMTATLGGTVSARLGPGRVAAELLQRLPQPLRGTWATWAKGAAAAGAGGVPIECATLDLAFKDGRSEPARFTMISGQVQVASQGRLDLAGKSTDIVLTAEPRPNSLLKKMQGTGYSARLLGSAGAPEISIAPFTSMTVTPPDHCVLTAPSKIPRVESSATDP